MPWSYEALLTMIVVAAAVYDLRFRRIPNWLTASGLVAGLLLNGFVFGLAGLKSSLLGIGLAMLIYVPLWMLRALGAGDAKLMMAVGSLVGPVVWLYIFLLTGILGGVIAVLMLTLKHRLQPTLQRSAQIVSHLTSFRLPFRMDSGFDVAHPQAVTLPHGATIAAGSLVYIVATRYLTTG